MQNLLPYILPQASNFALSIDLVLWLINIVCLIFAVGVAGFVIFFTARYRHRPSRSAARPSGFYRRKITPSQARPKSSPKRKIA